MQPCAASKFPQHVEDLDRAAASGDTSAVQAALRTLGLRSDLQAAARAIDHTGDGAKLRPQALTQASKLASTKLSVGVAGALNSPDDPIRYIWLRNAETGGLVTVRELGPTDAVRLDASIPKGLGITSVIPLSFSDQHGIWAGAEITL